jgi:DNA ligase-1
MRFEQGGIHLPELALWLDPQQPQQGPEKVFVSHAHWDHTALHREVILSAPTASLMQERLGGERIEHVLAFQEPRAFLAGPVRFEIELLPAGHIFGSAMARIAIDGKSLLYTGDFKLRRGLSAEPCQPRQSDILVMETTYGRPQYRFPPTAEVLRGVLRFCHEALDNDETPILFGYSLGKSQELLCGLGDAGLPLMLYGSAHRLTQIYQQFGHCFPAYEPYDGQSARGKVLLCPPHLAGSGAFSKLGRVRTAVLTGWAVEPSCRFRYQADAAFPLSDHADFPELVELVKKVAPKKVYTLHGFAADFAQTLRELGFDAQALSEQDQMLLPFPNASANSGTPRRATSSANSTLALHEAPAHHDPIPPKRSLTFHAFCDTCVAVAGTRSKLEKVRLLAEYLQALDAQNLSRTTVWFTGLPFAPGENKPLGLGWAAVRDALCAVGRISVTDFHHVYIKHSDPGETAFEILHHVRSPGTMTLAEVDTLFEKIFLARGPLAKLPLLIDALRKCGPLEAKFLVKILTGDLRIGLKEGLVEDAIAQAFAVPAEDVRQANLLLGHIGQTAQLARRKELASASIVPFRPVKFMLASPEETAHAIWERMQPGEGASEAVLWVEDKYDGIRCQLHKAGTRVALYSRDLKDITTTFPDIAEAGARLAGEVILDGELVAMRGDAVLAFAELQRRLGRREADLFMRDEVPIQFVVFDLLWSDGESFLTQPLAERRAALEALEPLPAGIRLAQITRANSIDALENAFAAARARNNEGLIVKHASSSYTPGRRGLAWLKLKKALATLDCVVVGAEYGHGKRNRVLSDYTFAVRDEMSGQLKTIGKAYSGLTDAEIAHLTEHFLKHVLRKTGRYHEVQPDTVLEIAFDRIQRSARHESGLAMRFPRIVRIRTDKTVADIDTLASARRLIGEASNRGQ